MSEGGDVIFNFVAKGRDSAGVDAWTKMTNVMAMIDDGGR